MWIKHRHYSIKMVVMEVPENHGKNYDGRLVPREEELRSSKTVMGSVFFSQSCMN